MNACGERRRRQPHVAADGNPLRLQIRDERRADGARRVFVDLVGIGAADVVRLEDVGIQGIGCQLQRSESGSSKSLLGIASSSECLLTLRLASGFYSRL